MDRKNISKEINKLNTQTALSASFALIVLVGLSVKLHLMGADFYAFFVFAATALYVFFSAKQIITSNSMLTELARKYDISEVYSGNTWLFPTRPQEQLKVVLSARAINEISSEADIEGALSESTYKSLKQSEDIKFYGIDNIPLLSHASQSLGIPLSNEVQIVSAMVTKSEEIGKHFDIYRDYMSNGYRR
ncbi:TPA: hypothetical protein R1871_000542 [Klebsiella oxytoca]|nr:hypothetical protein [Klebsiella oxytoca]HEC2043607.1 hypothetical protein [Klebsiella oxytoca]